MTSLNPALSIISYSGQGNCGSELRSVYMCKQIASGVKPEGKSFETPEMSKLKV